MGGRFHSTSLHGRSLLMARLALPIVLLFLSLNTLRAQPAPVAEFVANKAEVSVSEYVYLVDISSNSPDTWNWTITPSTVDGKPAYVYIAGTSNLSDKPVVYFYYKGSYSVTLYAANASGSDTTTKTDYITVLSAIDMCAKGPGVVDTVKDEKGYIYDDGGLGGQYGYNKNCVVIIKPPCADSISLTFKSFDVSVHAHSGVPAGDYLRIYDGKSKNGKSLHDSAGYPHGFQNQFPVNNPLTPPTVKAISGAMYLEWHTDASTIANGFEARWVTHLRTSAPPKAKFTGPDTVYEKRPATFSSLSTGPELRYLWDFDGNGTFDAADVSVATTTYPSAGLRLVTLVAINCGGQDTFIRKIIVIAPKTVPKADFKADVTRVSEGDVIRFTDISTEGPWQWKWTVLPNSGWKFVNGSNSSSQNPQIQFLDSGKYTVQLIATNSKGSATVTKTGYISVYKHCKPTVIDQIKDIGIARVELIDIANKHLIDQYSDAGTSPYTQFSLLGSTRLEVGGKYFINITRASAANKLAGKIWIDLNGDGDFTDTGEEIYSNNSITGISWSASFTIPPSITQGGSRMRIGVNYYNRSLDPCGSNAYGEFEDYAVNLMPDIIGPVITILGENPDMIEQCRTCSYHDAGATAFDNVDGNVTPKLKTKVSVNPLVVGYDTVTYEVTDLAGNKSVSYRVVRVIADTTDPQVYIIGADTMYHEVNTFYNDWGVAVEDNVTPTPQIKVDTVSTVDSTKIGIYTVTYTAYDKAKPVNKKTRVRVVIVQDKTPPDIIFLGGDNYKHQVGTPWVDPGVKVKDNYWPDSSYSSSGSVNVDVRGLYYVTYTATDQSGNTAVVKRTVKVDDYIRPKIFISAAYDTVELEVFKTFTDPPNIRMTDNYFPPAQLTRHRIGMVFDHFTGFYPIGYFASDPSGNLSDTGWIVVHVVDLEAPKMYMMGNIHDTVVRWHKYIDPGYIVGDNYDSTIDVIIGGTFKNTQVPGTFSRTYTGVDKSGNKSLAATRWITVVENLGMPEDELSGRLEVYPNPATHKVKLEIALPERQESSVYITDGLGQKVMDIYTGQLQRRNMEIDLSGFAGGMYFIHCQSGDNHITRKLVISR